MMDMPIEKLQKVYLESLGRCPEDRALEKGVEGALTYAKDEGYI